MWDIWTLCATFKKQSEEQSFLSAFSGGYSPHMIMSFAAPLGVGTTSLGEYFDIELTETVPTKEIEKRLNAVMAEGVTVSSARKVEDGKASTAMALVAEDDHLVAFRPGREPVVLPGEEQLSDFLAQKELLVTKKTKRSEKTVDIRPYIYRMELLEDGIFMQLASASSNYTKPELVMDTFLHFLGEEAQPFAYMIERREVYANTGDEAAPHFVPLEALGEEVE